MAAINFSVMFTDTGDNGAGPYTLSVRKDPTTTPAGGTEILSNSNTSNPKENLRALGEDALQYILNNITIAMQSGIDALN